MKLIKDMTDAEKAGLLDEIAALFRIGEASRTAVVLLENIKNASRRCDCLGRIETFHRTVEIDEDGEEYENDKLNWGEEPDKYIERYTRMIESDYARRGGDGGAQKQAEKEDQF